MAIVEYSPNNPRPNALVLRPCVWCGNKFSGRGMREHRPACTSKPKKTRKPIPRKTEKRHRDVTCRWCAETMAVTRLQPHLRQCSKGPSLNAGERICTNCQEVRSAADDFPANPSRPGHTDYTCHQCHRRIGSEWWKSPINRASRKTYERQKRYGVTQAEYDALVSEQKGLCAICHLPPTSGKGKSFHLDHDHESGIPRGLLCNHCNVGLGSFHDNPGLLIAAADYLLRHRPVAEVS